MKKKKGLVKSIVEYSIGFICLFLCLYISVEVIRANVEGRPPRIFNISVSYTPTGSMEPTIMTNDYVMFVGTDFDSVNEQDIIVYKSKTGEMAGNFIIHRIIEDHGDYFITQGDNNPLPDEEHITSDMIVGEYVCVIGFIGSISNNKSLLTVILFIVVILIFGCQFVSGYINKKQADMKKQE